MGNYVSFITFSIHFVKLPLSKAFNNEVLLWIQMWRLYKGVLIRERTLQHVKSNKWNQGLLAFWCIFVSMSWFWLNKWRLFRVNEQIHAVCFIYSLINVTCTWKKVRKSKGIWPLSHTRYLLLAVSYLLSHLICRRSWSLLFSAT